MGGLIFILVIVFIIVPLIKQIKESTGTDRSKNGNRYGGYYNSKQGGYNNPNVYNNPNNSKNKITYDWKPDYNFVVSKSDRDDQISQGSQPGQVSQGIQAGQGSQGNQDVRPYTAQMNAGQSPTAANNRPSAVPAEARPSSTAVPGSKPVSGDSNKSGKKVTAEQRNKERVKGKETGMNAGKDVTDVHVADTLLKLDAVMPDYNDLGFSIASYDIPESSAFKLSDVVVDAEVRVDAVIPEPKDTVRVGMKDKQ